MDTLAVAQALRFVRHLACQNGPVRKLLNQNRLLARMFPDRK